MKFKIGALVTHKSLSKRDIFRIIQSAGTKLNGQQIVHVKDMSDGRGYTYVEDNLELAERARPILEPDYA